MKVTELKALTREHGLRGYSQLKRAELVALLQNNPPPPPQRSTWEPIDDSLRPDRPAGEALLSGPWRQRQPSPQEMDILEQQEMSKSCPQVKNKLNDWYDWLVNHVPKTVEDKASRVFKTFKDKIMGLYNRVTGSTGNQAPEVQLKGSQRPLGPTMRSHETEPIELKQAFNGLTEAIGLMEGLEWM